MDSSRAGDDSAEAARTSMGPKSRWKSLCLCVSVVLLSIPGVGCSYLGNRASDFGDIFRLELSVGVGLQAHVTATEIAHVGLGSSRRYSGGLRYGEFLGERRIEDHFPVSYIMTVADSTRESLHSLKWGPKGEEVQHRCYAVVPGQLHRSTWEKDPIHYWDIEVAVMAGVVGVEAGFSFGQLIDFLVGLFGFDLAGDDGREGRQAKSYWRRVPEEPSPLRPRP